MMVNVIFLILICLSMFVLGYIYGKIDGELEAYDKFTETLSRICENKRQG